LDHSVTALSGKLESEAVNKTTRADVLVKLDAFADYLQSWIDTQATLGTRQAAPDRGSSPQSVEVKEALPLTVAANSGSGMTHSLRDALNEAGVSRGEFENAAHVMGPTIAQEIQDMKRQGLDSEAVLSEVTDKILESIGSDLDGLSPEAQMRLTNFCAKCLEDLAKKEIAGAHASM
jgi:hypothetical protein